MPIQRCITKNGRRIHIPLKGDKIPKIAEEAIEKAVPHHVSIAIKLANTDWDRAVSLLIDLIREPEKGLREIREDKNIQLIESILKQIQALRKS